MVASAVRPGYRPTRTGRRQYGRTREEAYLQNLAGPIPRFQFERLANIDLKGVGEEPGLADQIVRTATLRKAQLAPLVLQDMRLLRYYDPEKIEDHWSNWLTGEPLSKLESSGLSIEMYNWPQAVIEALTGLLAGHKPMAYILNMLPEDALNEADVFRAQKAEEYLYLEQRLQKYPVVYQDGVAMLSALGRRWVGVTINPKTKRLRTQIIWPGNVAAYWQEDQRTIEQVYVTRRLSLGEAVAMYPNKRDQLIAAVRPKVGPGRHHEQPIREPLESDLVTFINCWYRLGEWGDERNGMATVLMGDEEGQSRTGSSNALIDIDDDTGYPDIPFYCSPRFKTMDKTPDEATGALKQIAGVSTEYNEVVSAFRDMLWRAIYQRYVASGFSFRNAPRLDRTVGGVIPLPRTDQKLQRLDEVLNTVPIEQAVNRLEELVVVLPGLNRYFLGSAPPSETSGEAISAAIHASIVRLEPQRTNIQDGELWMYDMWLGLAERWGEFEVQGETVRMADIIQRNRRLEMVWRDVRPREEVKAKQLALSARQQGLISDDTALDEWPNVLDKAAERRKITAQNRDVWRHPREVAATASAIVALAGAKAQMAALAAQAQAMAPPAPGPGGEPSAEETIAGMERTAPGRPPSFEDQNEPGGGVYPPTAAGSAGNMGGPSA